jgi:hypothetical protein
MWKDEVYHTIDHTEDDLKTNSQDVVPLIYQQNFGVQ